MILFMVGAELLIKKRPHHTLISIVESKMGYLSTGMVDRYPKFCIIGIEVKLDAKNL